jgi:hypothetical protein
MAPSCDPPVLIDSRIELHGNAELLIAAGRRGISRIVVAILVEDIEWLITQDEKHILLRALGYVLHLRRQPEEAPFLNALRYPPRA